MFICGVNFDNTKSVRDDAKYIRLPPTPRGTETFIFEVGETCYSTCIGVYKPGVPFTIKDRYTKRGFAYYIDGNGIVHRTKDIQRNP